MFSYANRCICSNIYLFCLYKHIFSETRLYYIWHFTFWHLKIYHKYIFKEHIYTTGADIFNICTASIIWPWNNLANQGGEMGGCCPFPQVEWRGSDGNTHCGAQSRRWCRIPLKKSQGHAVWLVADGQDKGQKLCWDQPLLPGLPEPRICKHFPRTTGPEKQVAWWST